MSGKNYLLLTLSICSFYAKSQVFEESPISELFPYVDMSSINWVDYNNDGYLDLFIAGVVSPLPSSGHPETKLFKNINGEFQEVDTPFEKFSNGDSDWIDYDNDGDLDLMIAGLNSKAEKLTKLYNNVSGSFTEVAGSPFAQVGFWGGSAWADYDSDGDLDVFVTGAKSPGGTTSELYRNDGGTFTKVDIDVFGDNKVGATRAVEWFDFDNDGDPDLMLVSQSEAVIYENANGNFQIVAGTPFAPQIQPTLNVVDYDKDGDFDVMIAGNFSTKLYTNTSGIFTLNLELSNSIVQLNDPAIAWADFDNDDDQDVFVSGYSNIEGSYVARWYENKNGSFEAVNFEFYGVADGSVAWGDYDRDGDLDVIICGDRGNLETTKLYENKLIDNPVTGTSEELFQINVYPNPASNVLAIDCGNSYSYSITITDTAGRTHLQGTTKGKRLFDIEHLSPGLYFITLRHGMSIRNEKIVKIGY